MLISERILMGLILIFTAASCGRAEEGERPDTYPVELEIAEQFCVPVRSMFAEASRTVSAVGRRRFRHKQNGGFGLPVEQPHVDARWVHTGADVGWWQVREPVFAIADGIVRLSTGPIFKRPKNVDQTVPASQMPWGNLVVVEHRIGPAQYITSVYGHLGADRRVDVGDRVKVGQPLGTIGRKHHRINGGYDPHLHFGIRKGRNGEPGSVFLNAENGWNGPPVRITEVNERQIVLECETPLSAGWQLTRGARRWPLRFVDGRATTSSSLLWDWQRPEFMIEGYAPTIQGWLDPIQFLRDRNAVVNPGRL